MRLFDWITLSMTKSYHERNCNLHSFPANSHGQAGGTGDEGRASHPLRTGAGGLANVSLRPINPVGDARPQRSAGPRPGHGGLQTRRLHHSPRVYRWNGPSFSPGPQESHLIASRHETESELSPP